MSLSDEIEVARQTIVSDGYEMSVGEVMNLYRDKELTIDPMFQRLFRWNLTRKSRFIESLLLGIPIPPIFVYQDKKGVWELIDGLQRLSTIFEFAGQLRSGKVDDAGKPVNEPASILSGTKLLPSLQGKRWEDEEGDDGIEQNNQIAIKRARIRVEILKAESSADAKFELFQRLNTGGAPLSPQEVRNCVAVMINRDFYGWLTDRAKFPAFVSTTSQTSAAIERQASIELVLRFVAFRLLTYKRGMDVHEYLDDALIRLARKTDIDWAAEAQVFEKTFSLLESALGGDAFKRWDGSRFLGQFLMSVFEVISIGVAANLDAIASLDQPEDFVSERAKELWAEQTFQQNSGAGVRGTTRLENLLSFGVGFLKP